MIKHRVDDQPWFTDKCAEYCNKKCKAWYRFRKDHTAESKQEYSKLNAEAQKVYIEAQKEYKAKIQDKLIETSCNPKEWWRIVNHITGKGGYADIPTLKSNGTEYVTAAEKAEVLKNVFVTKSTLQGDDRLAPLLSNKTSGSITRIKFRARTVEHKLKHLKISKATGPDGIPARVLKECASVLAKPLTNLYTMSFSQGVVPAEWKCAQVVPVYKGDGKSDPNNYRPISLLPIICKIMESIVNYNLRKYLFGFKLISNSQYGFRPKHSTLDLLTSTTQR